MRLSRYATGRALLVSNNREEGAMPRSKTKALHRLKDCLVLAIPDIPASSPWHGSLVRSYLILCGHLGEKPLKALQPPSYRRSGFKKEPCRG
jgi:hypothetical protein